MLPLQSFCSGPVELKNISINFSRDLLELVDIASRIINLETHPNFYSLNESTVVGLQVKIIKLQKEALRFYEEDKAEMLNLLFRPLYESMIMSKYLIHKGEDSQLSYRLSSYKSRFENYKKLIKIENQEMPLVKEQLHKLNKKLELDGFSIEDLELEHKNKFKWRIDRKTFRDINKEMGEDYWYSFVYGGGSDSIHGNWNESFDYHLTKKTKGYFGYYYYERCSAAYITAFNRVLLESISVFLYWNRCLTIKLKNALNIMSDFNSSILLAEQLKYNGKPE